MESCGKNDFTETKGLDFNLICLMFPAHDAVLCEGGTPCHAESVKNTDEFSR